MGTEEIKIISNLFIISGIVLFALAVILALLRYKRERKNNFFDLKGTKKGQKGEFEEKRTKERHRFLEKVKILHPETKEAKAEAEGEDIHAEGAGLKVKPNLKIEPGTQLEIEFYLHGEEEPIRIGSEVAWTEGLENKDLEELSVVSEFFAKRLGLRFINLDEKTKKKIDIYIEKKSEEEKDEEESDDE
jgi:hypothetical protein